MELLIDKPSGQVYPEPGPNMMWNTKYGMMSGSGGYGGKMSPNRGGMMGPGGHQGMMGPNGSGQTTRTGAPVADMAVSPEQASRSMRECTFSSGLSWRRWKEPGPRRTPAQLIELTALV